MTEEEARSWIADRFGHTGVLRMERLIALLHEASQRQNLVASSTLDTVWARHIVDSAQLIDLAAGQPGLWIDIGTGAGFPGLVVAALAEREILLAEPRKRRVEFLDHCCSALGVPRARVIATRVEQIEIPAQVISARAVAPLPAILSAAQRCSTWNTLWLLPKGRSADVEIATAKKIWQGEFHVEHSATHRESMIVVAREVRRL